MPSRAPHSLSLSARKSASDSSPSSRRVCVRAYAQRVEPTTASALSVRWPLPLQAHLGPRPRRRRALSLHDPVHEIFFTSNEWVVFLITTLKGLPAALDGAEVSFLSCMPGGDGKSLVFMIDRTRHTSMRSSTSPAHPFMLTGLGSARKPRLTFLVMPRR
jgi:hypothetical protein